MSKTDADVIIIGGGPAGATAAALLAEKGRKVIVLEKSKFPRYHVGESLMPFCWFTLDRLGLAERMDEVGFTQKLSVQFVTGDGRQSRPFYFFQHYDHPSSTTWQVLRAQFDQMKVKKLLVLAEEYEAVQQRLWEAEQQMQDYRERVARFRAMLKDMIEPQIIVVE